MLSNPGTYANKKRKKPVLKQKKVSDGGDVVKSNPSKRHRDRLNGELDRLMDLLPFPEEVRSRLDKLSVLRLSVGFLRVKSYFKATMKNRNGSRLPLGANGQNGSSVDLTAISERDLVLQALDGFVMVVTSEGLVFYVSPTIKDYLGFHQSDVVHQSVFELIHTDDRGTFREQLHFALNPPPMSADEQTSQSSGSSSTVLYNPEQLPPENSSFLERSFVCRFRCLLDNSSGFLALKFQGRLKYLHGQDLMRENGSRPQLALFAIAMPVQAPSIVEIRAKMLLFQTKHKLDFTPTGVDSRGKIILGYSEIELCMKGSGYQFIHAADMMYCADNHIRMIKTGESGLTVFRLLSKSSGWVWVKSNAKLIYKGGRPEFIIAYQRALSNAEGEEYLRQRRLQLPFSSTTGEAILYSTNATMDVTQMQFNKMFSSGGGSSSSGGGSGDSNDDVMPKSLLDCFLRQDEAAYTQTVEPTLPVDQVFMDSRPLLSIASDSCQVSVGSPPVKEEDTQSILAVVDSLEKLAQDGDFDAVFNQLEVDDSELQEWERVLKRFNGEESLQRTSEELITDDIFDYIDSVFKEKGEDCLSAASAAAAAVPSCIADAELLPSVSGLYRPQLDGREPLMPPVDPPAAPALPSLQQLQLQDIFSSAAAELPELAIPDISADISALQSCQDPLAPPPSLALPPPGPIRAEPLTRAVPPQLLPSLIPCTDFSQPGFRAPCMRSDPLSAWTQNLCNGQPKIPFQNRGPTGPALSQPAPLWSSCMLEQQQQQQQMQQQQMHFPSVPQGGDTTGCSLPLQPSCLFDGATSRLLPAAPGLESADTYQHYLNGVAHAKGESLFAGAPLDVSANLME